MVKNVITKEIATKLVVEIATGLIRKGIVKTPEEAVPQAKTITKTLLVAAMEAKNEYIKAGYPEMQAVNMAMQSLQTAIALKRVN